MTITKDNYFQIERTYIKYPRFSGFKKCEKVDGYKALSFQKTIHNIISSLSLFLKNDNFIEHYSYKSTIGDVWINEVHLSNPIDAGNDIVLCRQFGKGLTLDASVASGYAELIERIQIGCWFSRNLLKPNLYHIFKTEISKKDQELNNEIFKITRNNTPFLPRWEGYSKKYIPYRDLYTDEEVLIDSIFLSPANGSASGNTYEEAFVQGLCEVFERYATLKILFHKIKCPTIPLEGISERNKEIIKQFNKDDIDIKVKDLSLEKGLPVVAVLFHHRDSETNEFHSASATSINLAIERCFTEKLQIFPVSKIRLRNTKRFLHQILKLYKTFPELNNYFPIENYYTYRFPNRGLYPSKGLNFLMEDYGNFRDWNYFDWDFNVEVKRLIEFCKQNKWHLYMKDYNWLGFPTIRVFVPELYFCHTDFVYYLSNDVFELKKKLILNIREIKSKDLMILSTPELLIHVIIKNRNLSMFLGIHTRHLDHISTWEFLSLLCLAKGNINLFRKFWKLKTSNTIQIKFNKEPFNAFSERLFARLESIIPICRQVCNTCKYIKVCRNSILEDIEKGILHKYPHLFTVIKNRLEEKTQDIFS